MTYQIVGMFRHVSKALVDDYYSNPENTTIIVLIAENELVVRYRPFGLRRVHHDQRGNVY